MADVVQRAQGVILIDLDGIRSRGGLARLCVRAPVRAGRNHDPRLYYNDYGIMTECPDFIFLIFVRRLFGAVPKVVVRCPEVVALFVLFLIC